MITTDIVLKPGSRFTGSIADKYLRVITDLRNRGDIIETEIDSINIIKLIYDFENDSDFVGSHNPLLCSCVVADINNVDNTKSLLFESEKSHCIGIGVGADVDRSMRVYKSDKAFVYEIPRSCDVISDVIIDYDSETPYDMEIHVGNNVNKYTCLTPGIYQPIWLNMMNPLVHSIFWCSLRVYAPGIENITLSVGEVHFTNDVRALMVGKDLFLR